MKKNIIIAAIAAASALLLSVSCQKESQPESQNGINGGAKTFTATIEQGLTKTTITSEYKVEWKTSDEININGVKFKATPDGTDATKATFAKDPDTQGDPTGETFRAIYPSTLYVTDHFALPATQTYTVGEFNAPMYAESTTTTLSFKNICAVLAIKVTSADINALKSIKVKSDKKLNGTFTVASTTDGYKAVIGTDGTDEVVLSVGETAINLTTDGITFYIAIPAQEYSYLKIYLSEDGSLYKRAMITKKAAGLGAIDCNTIYNIAYETNAVQMYAGGPYWSTMNLGAATETEYGDYYVWGATKKAYSEVDYEKSTGAFNFLGSNPYGDIYKNTWNASDGFSWNNTPFTDGVYSDSNKKVFTKYIPSSKTDYWKETGSPDNTITLDIEDDVANKVLGGNWRMPTKQDFTALANSCKEGGYISGNFPPTETKASFAEVTTKGVYWITNYNSGDGKTGLVFCDGTNKLFFPAAGFGGGASLSDAGDYGGYWSSTLYSSDPDRAYNLGFRSSRVYPQDYYRRYYGFPVRPVSD